MCDLEKDKKWDHFEENFDKDKYEKKGIAELGRMYLKNNRYINRYIRRDEFDNEVTPIPIVALGITAFSSFRHSVIPEYGSNTILGSQEFYRKYFDHCISFLRKIEERKPLFEGIKKTNAEIAKAHLEEEKRLLNESHIFYNELKYESERFVIDNIKRVVLYYPKWVEETYINTEITVYAPKSFKSDRTSKQLNEIRLNLIRANIIGTIERDDFEYLFTEKLLLNGMNHLRWKESHKLGHEFLKRLVYNDKQFDFQQVNACIKFADGKKLDSNDKSTAKLKNDDVLNPIFDV